MREATASALRKEVRRCENTIPRATGVERNTFEVNSSRERPPVARPFTTVCEEVSGLRCARGRARTRKVVWAAYDADVGRASIVAVEVGVNECCVFGRSVRTFRRGARVG